jgi:signal transduction histidine kinase
LVCGDRTTVAAAAGRVVGAWEDPRVDLSSRLHLALHPAARPTPSRLPAFAQLLALVLIDIDVMLTRGRTGPVALLVVLAALANAATLVWLFGPGGRHPLRAAALAMTGFAGGLLAVLQHGSPALALPGVAVAQAVADASVLAAVAVGALALVALEVGVVWAMLGASAALGYPAILVGSALVGLTRRQYRAQVAAAEALVAQTRRTESASRRAAALDERTRIAREIHDVLAHALGGLTVQLEAAELLLAERGDVDGALERIRGCRRTAREGLEEARRAVAALRSDPQPLAERLAGLVASHRDQGERGELIVEGSERELAPEFSLALMRAVQEGLTNARRHAPGSSARVCLVYGRSSTTVTITNDAATRAPAVAADAPTGGYGLTGMRERLELAGGGLAAGPSPDGWTLRAEIPA